MITAVRRAQIGDAHGLDSPLTTKRNEHRALASGEREMLVRRGGVHRAEHAGEIDSPPPESIENTCICGHDECCRKARELCPYDE